MLTTRFTQLLGCSVPIQQAGMGDLARPRLAAAIANAGGLGMVGVYGISLSALINTLDQLRAQTAGAIGANFIMRFVEPTEAKAYIAAAATRVNVVEFFYSEPDPALVEIVHTAGGLACWQVGSRAEAEAAAQAGCDFIIAQGIEAGGHVRGTIGLLPLLGQVLDAVDVPVLAAGGIGTGRALAAVLAAGADGVRMGTRFLAAEEADTHPQYLRALIAATAEDTIYTDTFSNGWPDAPHRCLHASVEAALAFSEAIVGQSIHGLTGESFEIARLRPLVIHTGVTGAIEAMPHWAGESVDGVRRVQTAAEIIHEFVEQAERLLQVHK